MNAKWKITVAAVATAAIASAPLAGAKPGNNGSGNGNRPTTPPGQTISAIAKSGGGAAGVLGALVQLRPTNIGRQNALRNVTKPKPTSTTNTTTDTTTPAPTTDTTTSAPATP